MKSNLLCSSTNLKNEIDRLGPRPVSQTSIGTSRLSVDPFGRDNFLLDSRFIDTTEQNEVSIIVHNANSHKHLKLGNILIAKEMLTFRHLMKAIRIRRHCKKFLGEVLVEIGAISRVVLALALKSQRKALTMTLLALMTGSLASCVAYSPGHYDHTGTSTPVTPYNNKYQKVHEYLETASRFEYKADVRGADYWQLPSETERLGTGDCDDKAIWLYSKLIKEGIDNIRLVLGNYKSGEFSVHMWVNWYQDGQVFILDPSIDNGIRSAYQYWKDYYQPFYSFHKGEKWTHFNSLN
ncbi:MAG: hypothetical protein ACUZ8N_00605 [Candidatus Scalindua sp.]